MSLGQKPASVHWGGERVREPALMKQLKEANASITTSAWLC